jgi:hypothetical protein
LPERWSLFLDESGDFGDEDATRVVAGLLLELPAADLARKRLREELGDIWGPGPFPPHAAHLNLIASLPVYAAWKPSAATVSVMAEGRIAAAHRPYVRAAARALEASPYAGLLAAAEAGRLPSYGALQEANAWLRVNAPNVYFALQRVQAERSGGMSDLLARLFRRLGGGATIVAAQADRGAVGRVADPGELRADAYVRTLAVVAERVARVADGAVVDVHVLTRNVQVGGVGTTEMGPWQVRQVMEAAAAATTSAVAFRPAPFVQRYDDRPDQGAPFHPALAVADWLANRIRHHLNDHPQVSWARLAEGLATSRIAPSVPSLYRAPMGRTTVGALPMIASAGIPEEAVRAAFAAQPPPPLPAGWTGDQARSWVGAAGRWA